MTVLIVFGTRPEAIKLAPVVTALRRAGCGVRVCATAQHREMLDQVLAVFELRCDDDLNVMRGDQALAALTGLLIAGVSGVIARARPDLVVVQGDTTTTMAAALAAFYAGVPVAHVEAGLRSDNLHAPWPEEMNRRVVSVIAALHLAPTEQARARLLAEGVPAEAIAVTGNTVVDALLAAIDRLDREPQVRASVAATFPMIDPELPLVLLTSHRRETFGEGLERICRAVRAAADRQHVQFVYPVHLNRNVVEPVERLLGGHPRIHLIEPVDYLRFVYLLQRCDFVLTDSGGVQEEAPALGKPVLVMRDVTERPEGLDAGVARLVGTGTSTILRAVEALITDRAEHARMAKSLSPYGDGRAAERVAAFLVRWWQDRRPAPAAPAVP